MVKPVKPIVTCLDMLGYDALQKIEMAGRVCYDSNLKAKPGSDEGFVKGILKSGHESVIEHEGCIFHLIGVEFKELLRFLTDWNHQCFFQVSQLGSVYCKDSGAHCVDLLISGDFRSFRDFAKNTDGELGFEMMRQIVAMFPIMFYNLPFHLQKGFKTGYPPELVVWQGLQSHLSTFNYFNSPNDTFMVGGYSSTPSMILKHGTLTFRIDGVSRILTHQLVRHRMCAFSQRSQRYCVEDNFGYVVTPDIEAVDEKLIPGASSFDFSFFSMMDNAANNYAFLKKKGLKKEDARFVLPNACSTSIVVTATLNEWCHMISLRCAPDASWEIRNVFKEIHKQICDIAPDLMIDKINIDDDKNSKSISRKEALDVCKNIMKRSEEGRLQIAEEEAKKGIDCNNE